MALQNAGTLLKATPVFPNAVRNLSREKYFEKGRKETVKRLYAIIAIVLVAALAVILIVGNGSKGANTKADTEVAEEKVPEADAPSSVAGAFKSAAKKAASSTPSKTGTQTTAGKAGSGTAGSKASSGVLSRNISDTITNAIDTLQPAVTNPEGAWESYGNKTANTWENYGESWSNFGHSVANQYN